MRLSFIPELGVGTNSINALIEVSKGNYGQAGIYGAAAAASVIVPGMGAMAKGAEMLTIAAEAEAEAKSADTIAEGAFSIIDWSGYPSGLPKPDVLLPFWKGRNILKREGLQMRPIRR